MQKKPLTSHTEDVKTDEGGAAQHGQNFVPEKSETRVLQPTDSHDQDLRQQDGTNEELISVAMAGISPGIYSAEAKKRNRRQLLCMLRDARKKLMHHGNRSFMGKEAKKQIDAVEAELQDRGIVIPPEGQETVAWKKESK